MSSKQDVTVERVLMVVRLFHPWVGGTERQAHKLSAALIDRGVPVTVLTGRWFPRTSRTEVLGNVPVFRNHTLWEFFGVRGLRKLGGYLYMVTLAWYLLVQRRSYDIVHVHGLSYHTAVVSIVGRMLGKPVVTKLANSGEASDIERMRRGQQLLGTRFLVGSALKCDRFVALNSAIVSELHAAGVGADRIVTIPNGVELESASGYSHSVMGHLRLVYVGRLHRQKGVDILIAACRILVDRGCSDFGVRIVGDGPERSTLEDLALRSGVADLVQFVGTLDDPGPEVELADVFVLPSRTEGMSNALLEAMAKGKAVVAAAVPGSAEVVRNGHSGRLFEPGDPISLANVLQELAGDPGALRKLGSAARSVIERSYSMEYVAERYRSIYSELLAQDRSAASTRGATND